MTITNSFLVDACVILDILLPFRDRHEKASELVKIFIEKKSKCLIPSHAYFEYAVATIVHWKNDPEEIKKNPPPSNFPAGLLIEVIDLTKIYVDDLFEVMLGQPIPDLKSQDLIYFCIARSKSLPLITEDRKLKKTSKNGGLMAYDIDEAITLLNQK